MIKISNNIDDYRWHNLTNTNRVGQKKYHVSCAHDTYLFSMSILIHGT